jgi:hypothetical protein
MVDVRYRRVVEQKRAVGNKSREREREKEKERVRRKDKDIGQVRGVGGRKGTKRGRKGKGGEI